MKKPLVAAILALELLAAAWARGADGTVVFNEIMYHPATNEAALEWVELHSLMTVDMDLSGWSISGGIDYVFPPGTIVKGGGYLVVAISPATFQASTGLTNLLGPFTGRLSNGGEQLELRNNNGRLIDEVAYGDDGDWPVAADGSGASLLKREPNTPRDAPGSWAASPDIGGSPGARNFRGTDPTLVPLVSTGALARVFVPADNSLLETWTAFGFDDSQWQPATATVGYDVETNDLYAVEVMADQPAGYWRLSETNGSTALDRSGNGRHGAYNGGVTRGVGGALPGGDLAARFDGASGYVQLPGTWGGGAEATVEEWVNTEAPITGDFQSLISTPDGGFTHFQLHTTGNAGAYTSSGFVALPIPPPTPTDRWRHVVMTIKSGDSRIYVDGVALGSPVTTTFTTITPATFSPGGTRGVRLANGHQGGRWFRGRLDEAAIYNRALPPERVQAHYLARTTYAGLFGTDLRAAMHGQGSSAYVRIPFAVTNADLVDAFTLRVRYDDGFRAYVNGALVAARNAPALAAFDSVALTNRAKAAVLVAEEIALTNMTSWLREGTNVLAIHGLNAAVGDGDFLLAPELLMHQGDRVFSLNLNEVSAANDPAFRVELLNRGPGAVNVGGYLLANPAGAGGQYVLPSQVLPTSGFLVVSAAQMGFALRDGDQLALYAPSRSAVLDAITVRSAARGRAPDGTGEWLFTSAPSFGGTNVVARRDDIVINEIMYNHLPVFETPAVYQETALLRIDASWRYSEAGIDLGTAWRQPGYDDSAWPAGAALFYVTTAPLPAPKNTPLTLGRRTYYFRTEFLSDGATNGATFTLHPIIDDGAVLYLNGVEVLRVNMPGSAVSYATYASASIGNATYTGPFAVPATNLATGTNTLAVEVHQASVSGNDVVFGVELRQRVELTPATPFQESAEQWLELYNRGSNAVDLTGWRLDEGIDFRFTYSTTIPAGGYLVVAKDGAALQTLHPSIALVGPFTNQLSRRGERVVLKDAFNNPADAVHYFDGGRWPEFADGGGPSLELRDPRSDNATAEAWDASNESGHSQWQTYRYRGVAAASLGPDTQWREFVLGLLDAGEVLLDDVSVVEDPDGTRVQMLQNTSFDSGLGGWRIIGNHHGEIVPDPDIPGNPVLRLVARGPTEHWSNHAETTLANNRSVVNGRVYEISFRAKWLAGCPKLNTRLYFNRLPRTTRLAVPTRFGTPGAPNSRLALNIGPTFAELRHSPVVPNPAEPVTVTVRANDPDGVASVTLWFSINGGAWSSLVMPEAGAGEYGATLSGTAAATLVQFCVRGADGLGTASFFPAAGPASRALYRVNDGQADFTRGHNVRILMTPADADLLHRNSNLMSNDPLGCTVIYDEVEVFYDARVRLRGTSYGRPYDQFVSFSLEFPPDHLFRGAHRSIDLDRSGRGPVGSPGQDEILIRHLITHAGGLPGDYTDLARLIAPRPQHISSALLYLGHYTGDYLDAAYPDGSDGTLFELDGAYYPTRTTDGNPQSPKVVEAGPISYTDLRNLGDDPEAYRWNFSTRNNRTRDDYSRLIPLAKAFGLTGAALDAATQELMDVNEWLRLFAVLSLTGIGDVYTQGNPHNLWLYARPGDRRLVALPHDLDVSFARPPTAPLTGENGNLLKIINLPANQRLFYWHLRDLITAAWNTGYMARWTDHYDDFLPGQDFSGILSYIGRRADYVLNQLPRRVPFAILTQGGSDFLTNQPSVNLRGSAWLDVDQVRLDGSPNPLALTWLNATNWQVTLPLVLGANLFTFLAVDHQTNAIATNRIAIATTAIGGGQDTDTDGLPDRWELSNGLSPSTPDASVDSDGDGLSNYAEYLAGTDSRDAQSFLKLDAVGETDGAVKLSFSATAGRSYSVLQNATLEPGSWTPWTNLAARLTNHPVKAFVPAGTGEAQRFYRLVTPRQP
ncbi:MAG: lamin tail domain-containing protein [Chloroflexi bacterium]|nr:lamin tail domain-containing protein [Chloroflexota bacterium]